MRLNKTDLFLTILIVFLAVSVAGCSSSEDGGEVAEFEVSDLEIEDSVELSETVNGSIMVENVGQTEGIYQLEIYIDGELRTKENFTYKANEKTALDFWFTADEPGSHQIKVDDLSDTFEVESGLELTEFSFASNISGKDDYVSHSSTYSPTDIIDIYWEADGFEFADDAMDVTGTLAVYGPEDDVGLEDTFVDGPIQQDGTTEIWFSYRVIPPSEGFEAGEYEVEINLKDNHANKDLTITRTFIIK